MTKARIIYTETDEAPRLATFSLLPVIKAFTDTAGVEIELWDISLSGRILAAFPEYLTEEQRTPDYLAMLGELTRKPEANIIKLPNISAPASQLQAAIRELQEQGYALPDYPETPASDEENAIRARYDRIKGSAVNPVLRQGSSDRRSIPAVKEYARQHPHRMGAWRADSKSQVVHMTEGDFYGSEQSITLDGDNSLRITFDGQSGNSSLLVRHLPVLAGDLLDAAFMSKKALSAFLDAQVEAARAEGLLFSVQLKATMMKISDPIIFGHAVRAFYKTAFEKHAVVFEELGVDANQGVSDAYRKISRLPEDQALTIKADLDSCLTRGPGMAMVDSDRGITNLHEPNDIIIDAAMPVALRDSGKMYAPDGSAQDFKAVIPDRCYAGIYQAAIDHCRTHGAFDPTSMGNVANVGLMAERAEEYGSHDTTFESPEDGTIRVLDSAGKTLLAHQVEKGDIWRLCRTTNTAIRDWIRLALKRARATSWPLVFWLDEQRAHDASLISRIDEYLRKEDSTDIEYHIMAPVAAMHYSLDRARKDRDTISVTGNVLRDYLTDLFPILELGTSAKMLSIVPLIEGGSLFETGAGGSAPKHVQQFEKEGHLRWDSLGEFMALYASLEHLVETCEHGSRAALLAERAALLAETLNQAIRKFLDNNRSPSRVLNELDTRGSHFYLAMYWAEALAARDSDPQMQTSFEQMARQLRKHEDKINNELLAAQGSPQDLHGYYHPDPANAMQAMRPSATLNAICDNMHSGQVAWRPSSVRPAETGSDP